MPLHRLALAPYPYSRQKWSRWMTCEDVDMTCEAEATLRVGHWCRSSYACELCGAHAEICTPSAGGLCRILVLSTGSPRSSRLVGACGILLSLTPAGNMQSIFLMTRVPPPSLFIGEPERYLHDKHERSANWCCRRQRTSAFTLEVPS